MSDQWTETILVVETDPHINEAACRVLSKHGFTTFSVFSAREVQSYLTRVDLILLDLNLPDKDGLEVLRELRKISDIPIIVSSAHGQGNQRVLRLELGADDYLTKPVYPAEMVARVKALLRRLKKQAVAPASFVLNETARTFVQDGIEISLAQQEFQLLHFLAESPGEAFTRKELLSLVWQLETDKPSRRVDLAVSRIRVKFAEAGLDSPLEAVWKVGYRFKGCRGTTE